MFSLSIIHSSSILSFTSIFVTKLFRLSTEAFSDYAMATASTDSVHRALGPAKFNMSPDEPGAEKEFRYWAKTLANYIRKFPDGTTDRDKLDILTNFVSCNVEEYISDATSYVGALETLKGIYIKPQNNIFARHLLRIRRQQPGESVDQYLQSLKSLARDCNFEAVDAITHRDKYIVDTFIAGLQSNVLEHA